MTTGVSEIRSDPFFLRSTSPRPALIAYLLPWLVHVRPGCTDGVMGGDDEPGRSTLSTNLPFDAIELSYVQSGGTAHVEVQVYEFCTSAN